MRVKAPIIEISTEDKTLLDQALNKSFPIAILTTTRTHQNILTISVTKEAGNYFLNLKIERIKRQ